MPGVSGVTVVTTLVCFVFIAYEIAGAASARHSLRPLIRGSDASGKTRVKTRGEIAKLCPSIVMPRFKRGIQYAVISRMGPRRLWNTGIARSSRATTPE